MFTAIRQPRWAVAPLAAGLVLLMLLGAVAAGLRVPGLSLLSGLPGFGLLDYRTLSGGAFVPLRADYLDELLGTGFGERGSARGLSPVAALGGDTSSGVRAASVRPLSPGGAGFEPPPVVLDHELTNDDLNNPIVITRLPFAARTDTTRATRQDEEPTSCSATGRTAWYQYTAARDGLLSADTFGSDHATAVGVFRGASGSPVEQVGCATGARGDAQIAFDAARGSTYLFQVAGLVDGGRLRFHLAAPGHTSLASGAAAGRGPAEGARWAHVSGDGMTVAFETAVSPACKQSGCQGQIYVLDRRTGRTTLVSKSSSGDPGNSLSLAATLSHDGRYVAFTSGADNLVPGDSNDSRDIFVHDRRTGRTTRASVDSQGRQGARSELPADVQNYGTGGALSADGRFLTFFSALGGLVANDRPGTYDVFVRDLRTGQTTRETVDEAGNPLPGEAVDARVSRDGRFVAFLSSSRTLGQAHYPACDRRTNPCYNLFLRDRHAGTTRIVSVDRDGDADMAVDRFDMSEDGRVLAWTTTTPLDRLHDTNGVSDVYVIESSRQAPRRVSLSSTGEQQREPAGPGAQTDKYDMGPTGHWVTVSGDGSSVAFDSRSADLVADDDTNGASDVFLRHLSSGVTTRVSASSFGRKGDGDSYRPSLSHQGTVVVFESDAGNLVRNDRNRLTDVFVHDLRGV